MQSAIIHGSQESKNLSLALIVRQGLNIRNNFMMSTWANHNLFTIKIYGDNQWVKERVATLVDDFNEPKFGWNGELWDEE